MRDASRQVAFLLNEGYDLKSASAFVGNHFLLSERQRLAITRSLATDKQLKQRKNKQKVTESLAGQEVWIDGFNTVITAEVMLSDSILLLGMDGCIRDLAALRGTYRIIPETSEAIRMIFGTLQTMEIQKANILLDEPVSNSGRLKALIAKIGEEFTFEIDIHVLKDVDRTLYQKKNVVSSDSIILDHCESWINLMGECLKQTGKTAMRVW